MFLSAVHLTLLQFYSGMEPETIEVLSTRSRVIKPMIVEVILNQGRARSLPSTISTARNKQHIKMSTIRRRMHSQARTIIIL